MRTTCLPFNSFSFHCVPVSFGAGLAGEVAPGAAAAASLRTGVCAQPAVMATMAARGISLASVNMAILLQLNGASVADRRHASVHG
ncbi:hypothetical protein D3C81_1991940 [compost metagenome]